MTTLYVAGPMTGYPDFNYPAFAAASERLRAAGFVVISPHELDVDFGDLPDFSLDDPASFTPAHYAHAIRRDLHAILDEADGIATLTGWHESKGATLEVAVAKAIGISVRHVTRWLYDARTAQK